MNKGFYKDLDTNFEQALELSERKFTHFELLDMLKNGNIPQKQIAALKLDYLSNIDEAQILVSNLTGCDGKIREAVALKINQFLNKNSKYIEFFNQPEIFANASIDINGNICRLVIDSVSILKTNNDFANIYIKKILNFIEECFSELDKFVFRDKKYVINKQLFKLYWALEALRLFASELDNCILYSILEKTSKEREYTIREQTAKIINKLNSSNFDYIKKDLLNDENYYVKNCFVNEINQTV